MLKVRYTPFIFHVISIFAGTLGITFTLISHSLPALTFDSVSLFSALIAVFKDKKLKK